MVTLVTLPFVPTTTVALAPTPEPLLNGTLMYVPGIYPLPPILIAASVAPLPLPPIFVFGSVRLSPSTYPRPLFVMVTEDTVLPLTTTVAKAPDPDPPVSGTFVYVAFSYPVPPFDTDIVPVGIPRPRLGFFPKYPVPAFVIVSAGLTP